MINRASTVQPAPGPVPSLRSARSLAQPGPVPSPRSAPYLAQSPAPFLAQRPARYLATATSTATARYSMASLLVLMFDHEGRPVQFDTWLDDLQLYLLSDSKDSVSLFDLASGAATAPPATADNSTRSQWLTRDAAARLAIRNHPPLAECAHFGQHRTAQALYDAVVARYSSPATTALGRLLLPYRFPQLSSFAIVEDLVSYLRASDARYCAAVPAEFLDRYPPPMYITLYFIVIRLPDALRSVRDHFLSLDPTSLTVDLLEQHLLAAKTSAVAVGAARGTPRQPFFEGCSPSPLAPSYTSAAATDVSVCEDVGAAFTSAKRRNSKGKGGRGGGGGSSGGGGGSGSGGGGSSGGGGGGGSGGGSGGSGGGGGVSGGSGGSGGGGTGARRVGSGGGERHCPYVIRMGDRAGQTCGRLHTQHRCFSRLDDAWHAKFGDNVKLPRWADLLKSRIAIFDLDFDAILSAMYALSVGAEGDCYLCVPLDPIIAAAAPGASESGTLPGTAPTQALHTFMLDSGASRCFFRDSTTLTPLPAPVPVRLADPFGGSVVAQSSTVLPCPAVPSGSLSGLHLPLFSTNLPPLARLASCRTTLLWHHRLCHPSLPRLRGMHSRLLVSGLPRSLPPLPPSPAPPFLPCVEGRQRPAPHSSSFPPTSAPLQTLHMDVWGPARVCEQSRERYFLLVVDDYSRYTTVFPLHSKGQAVEVLIPWIRTVRLQLRERFGQDLPVLRLHSDRGGEFSSNLLRDFCRGEGILQTFTLPDSPQQNGIAECRIGLVMEVARTSMIHAAAPHFLWPFAVQYAAHQLNLWPRVSLLETSPTLRWTGKVGDASVFRVWGSRAFVRDTSADKLSPRAIPCDFLGFVPDAPGWQFYHPTSCRIFPSQDVTFNESVPFYHPLPGPAPVQVAVDSGAARGAASGGAESEGAETGGAEPGGLATGGAELGGVATGGGEPRGAKPERVELGGAASEGADSGGADLAGADGASPSLSPQRLCEWFVRRTRIQSGATGAGGAGPAGAGGTGVAAGAGVSGGAATTGSGSARTRGTGAAGTGGVEGAGAGVLTESGTTGAGGARAGGAGVGGPGAKGAGVGGPGVGGAGAGGVGAVDPGGAVRPRPHFVPLLQQSQPPLQPASPLPAPSPYTAQSGGLTKRRELASCPLSPVRTACRVPRSRPPPVLGTHAMTLRPSSVPLRLPLRAPPESSLPEVSDPEFDRARATSPTVSCLLATAVSDPYFEFAAASALVAELLDFAAACRLDYATTLVAESASASPLSTGGECALGTDVLEDRQEDFGSLAAAVPHFASMRLAPEGDPDAPDIPTPRSYAEAITGPYSSQWQAAMDAEMASWKSTRTYVDAVPPPRVNIVDGIWIFRGVDYFQTFSPTPKMTTLRVLLDVAAQRDYELHSLDFSTALRRPVYGLREAPREWHDTLRTTLAALGFVPATADPTLFLLTHTSLPPFYVLVYVDDLVFATGDTEAVLQRFGFQFSSPQPTPLSTSHSLSAPPSDESVEPSGPYPELVGCLMNLMTCTRPDLAYPLSLLARYVAPGTHRKVHWDAAKRVLRYLCITSRMGLVLGGRGPIVLTGHADASWVDDSATQRSSQAYTFSLGSGSASWRSTRSSSVLSSMCEAEIYTGAMAA
ncbi:unnamed protein product [Closterium sp. NIES-53]